MLSTVLLVDDDPMVLAAGKRSLGGLYRVLTTTTLAEARAQCAQDSIQTAIVDLHLGEHSGLDLLKELHRDRRAIRTALLTAHLSHEATAAAALAGAIVIASKPVSFRRLVSTLETASEGGIVIRGSAPGNRADDAFTSLMPLEVIALGELTRQYARAAFDSNGQNVSKTARKLRISRSRLYTLLADDGDASDDD